MIDDDEERFSCMVLGLCGFWNLDLIFLSMMVGVAFSHCNHSSSSPSNSWASKSAFSIRPRAPIHNTNTNLVVSFLNNINNQNYYAARRRRRRLRCSPSSSSCSSSSSGKVEEEEEEDGSGRELVFSSLMEQRGGKMVAQLVGTFNQLTHRNTAITTLASSSLLLLFNTLKLAIPILQSLPPPPLALHARSPLTKALSVAFILADLQVRSLLFFSLFIAYSYISSSINQYSYSQYRYIYFTLKLSTQDY